MNIVCIKIEDGHDVKSDGQIKIYSNFNPTVYPRSDNFETS